MTIQAAIPAAIRLILADPTADVIWGNREAGYRAAANVRLGIVSRPRRGVDEVRHSDPDPTTGAMVERVYGVRRLSVQVTCETQDQDIADSAHTLAETLRTGFYRTDVEAILDASDLGGVQTTDPRTIDYKDAHGRWRSAVAFEVWLNTHTTHTGATVETIGTVVVGGEVEPGAIAFGPLTVDEG